MAEKLSKHESYRSAEADKKRPEKTSELSGEQAAEEKLSLEKIRHQIKQEKAADQETVELHNLSEKKPHDDTQAKFVSNELKQNMHDRALTEIRKQLPPLNRSMSRVIHQPVFEKLSDVAAKTILRPTIILCGGLASLVGGVFLLYYSRHYHFKYNFFAFFLFFAAGLATGIVIDIIIFFSKSKKSRRSSI